MQAVAGADSRPCHGEPITLFSVADTEQGRGAAEEAVANAKALLKAMTIPVHETKVAVGGAVEEIVESGALYKIIVVTDEGRSRFQRLFRGSTATEVVRKARTRCWMSDKIKFIILGEPG
jgi:nucleotide-binding universal stress UspA family protein